ncbi:MAG: hypothetical protein DDT19_00257 [Syntrophomonadaceae bacterium]|nr:hypothetical protein [Bacillota bacterium]
MTRTSNNEYQNGRLWYGYDYDKQVWVVDGKYDDCGHPEEMKCTCYGRLHKGEDVK